MSYVSNGRVPGLKRSIPYYQNYLPVASVDEQYAPVPGWGMSANMAGPRRVGIGSVNGLGYDLSIGTPIGPQKISIPVEKLVTDSLNTAWPQVRTKLMAEVPGILDMAAQKAKEKAINELWPELQPKLRGEVNRAVSEAKVIAVMVGLAVVGSVFVSSAMLKRSLSR